MEAGMFGPGGMASANPIFIQFNQAIRQYELIIPNTGVTLNFAVDAELGESFGVEALASAMESGTAIAEMVSNAEVIFTNVADLGFALDAQFFTAVFTEADAIIMGDAVLSLAVAEGLTFDEALAAVGEALAALVV